MKKDKRKKEEIAEDYCFKCKDGGLIRVCDYKNCLKAYHPQCVEKDDSFLETDERWSCDWHSCFNCKKSSIFQCYCCPYSVCRTCIKEAAFVQVKKRTKGFCNDCLKLAILIEEGVDVDSDGGKVDFKDTETYEFLFKDYWEIVKDQEGIKLVDLHAADALLKRGQNYKVGLDSDRPEEESEIDELEDDCADGKSIFEDLKGKRRPPIKRCRSKNKTYMGWGSEELIGFLASIGKDVKEPLTQLDACEIVKEYVHANNLLHPGTKKKNYVSCDERLHSLFRKKKVKFHKIYSLLESHFAGSDGSDEAYFFSSEEDDNSSVRRKQRKTNSGSKLPISEPKLDREKVLERPASCYASIVDKNIKSIYLKRSLILDLVKTAETFEDKVMGCFVRVKSDPKDFYYDPRKIYQLGQVTGIKKASQPYKIGETCTDIVLCVSNMWKDIQLSMLSDDDFEEEECEDIRQLVKKGLFKRPTIAELEKKIRSVHEDITNHWIDREIVKLQKQIDRANEKGWRRELFECIDRRELLRTPEERVRLLKEIPQVIAETEEEIEANMNPKLNSSEENKGNGAASCENAAEERRKGSHVANEIVTTEEGQGRGAVPVECTAEGTTSAGSHLTDMEAPSSEAGGIEVVFHESAAEVQPSPEGGFAADRDAPIVDVEGSGAVLLESAAVGTTAGSHFTDVEAPSSAAGGNEVVFHESAAEVQPSPEGGFAADGDAPVAEVEGNGAKSEVTAEEVKGDGVLATATRQVGMESKPDVSGEFNASSSSSKQIIQIGEDEDVAKDTATVDIQIIDLGDDECADTLAENDQPTADTCCEILEEVIPESHEVWHYVDPSGNEHGPFAMKALRHWREKGGFFDDDFKVWRAGQSQKNSILLTDALRQTIAQDCQIKCTEGMPFC